MRPDLTRQEFGRWRVIWRADFDPYRPGTRWICRCSCGAVDALRTNALQSGTSRQCRACYFRYGSVRGAKPAPSLFDVISGLRDLSTAPALRYPALASLEPSSP